MTKTKFLSEEQKEVCKKTLELMPLKFSTNGFIKAVQMLSSSDLWINKYQSCYFLSFYALRVENSKSWIKKNQQQNLILPTTSSNQFNDLFNFNVESQDKKTILNDIDIKNQNCLECGNEFELDKFSRGQEKKYCSTLCRSRSAWKRRVEKYKLDQIDKIKNKKEVILDDINQAIKTLVDTGMYKIYIKSEEFKEII
jgi:hypothetical protein